jgi:putative transcriptional regulator
MKKAVKLKAAKPKAAISKSPALYHYQESGLDNIYLKDGFIREQNAEYGELISVVNAGELHNVIGAQLAAQAHALNGKEIRFLRKELNMSQRVLAQMLGVDEQTVARWEKEQIPMPRGNQLVLRSYYLDLQLGDGKFRELVEKLIAMDEVGAATQKSYETIHKGAWRVCATQ